MPTSTYRVTGMSCEHCVRAVDAELAKLATVSAVAVDLASGDVIVTSGAPLDRAAVAAAVEEAGYALGS
jgi:copper chaperone